MASMSITKLLDSLIKTLVNPRCYPNISSSILPFSSCLQFFQAPGVFPMSHFFASVSQSIRTSASASVLPMNIQDWFPLGACSNSCPSSWWCHTTISSSAVPFTSCLQSFPASGSFLRSQFFTSGGQSIGVSASASALPMNIQHWFLLGLTGLTSLQSKDSQESSPTPQFKSIISLALSFLCGPTLKSIHDYWKNLIFQLSIAIPN